MTQTIVDASVEVFEPNNTSIQTEDADMVIPAKDIATVSTKIKISKQKDTATFEIHNDDGEYSDRDGIDLTSGQRVQFRISLGSDIRSWGEEAWGHGAWGGEHLRWTGVIRDIKYTYAGPNKSFIEIKAEDFVFGIMSKRLVFDSFTEKPIAGNSNSILNKALSDEAPEINKSKIEDFTDQITTMTADGTDLLEFSINLMDRANAVMYSRRDRLHFEDPTSKSVKFEIEGSDIGYFTMKLDDSGLNNVVRVDGGTEKSVDDQQTTQNDYHSFTKSNREMFQVSTRKASIAEIEIWTHNISDANVTVRIQKDDGGSPVAPSDKTSDIASKTLSHEFVANDGFTTFIMPEHTLPEPNPWIILQTDGDKSQEVGVDNQGTTSDTSDDLHTYKAWYDYTITVRKSEVDSRSKYRKREHRIKDDSIRSASEARAVAQEKLNHDAVPEKKIAMPVESERAHHLKTGQVVSMDFPRERATGEYIVTERKDDYQDGVLDSSIKIQEVDSL